MGDALCFVDLPGYGYARVSQERRRFWGELVSGYVEQRQNLVSVVVIVDLRHELKQQDLELVNWLRFLDRHCLLVYTKADKLSRNQQERHAALLDAGFRIKREERVLFSSHTGQGRDALLTKLEELLALLPARDIAGDTGTPPADDGL